MKWLLWCPGCDTGRWQLAAPAFANDMGEIAKALAAWRGLTSWPLLVQIEVERLWSPLQGKGLAQFKAPPPKRSLVFIGAEARWFEFWNFQKHETQDGRHNSRFKTSLTVGSLSHMVMGCFERAKFIGKRIVYCIWMFPKIGGTTKSSILIGFSIFFTIHFGLSIFFRFPPLYTPKNTSWVACIGGVQTALRLQPSDFVTGQPLGISRGWVGHLTNL